MPSLANVVAFVGAAALIFVTPGPSAFFVMGRALSSGRRVGLISVAGNALGVVPAVVLVSVGVGSLVAQSVYALLVVKVTGALFLIYLGWRAWRQRGAVTVDPSLPRTGSTWRLLVSGVFVGCTNPKAVVVLVAILPQFVDAQRGHLPLQLLVLGLLSVLLGAAADCGWVLTAVGLRGRFSTSDRGLRRIRGTGGLLLMGLGTTLLVTSESSE
jgi:threonine/homoserine/homoserine lactone efflux protein